MASLPYVVEDLKGVIQIFSDGSIHRRQIIDDPVVFPVNDQTSVVWKDFCYHKPHNLHLRIYKPTSTTTTAAAAAKLPVVYYLHGGGFCVGAFSRLRYHNFCLRIAETLHVVVVAPNLRLAPEHRLPAAIDDAFVALEWLRDLVGNPNGDGGMWVGGGVDFERFCVFGDSSGGNIAHHMAVRLGPGSPEVRPVRIRAYVMLAPFFGGTERTKSEAEGEEKVLNVDILDTYHLAVRLGSGSPEVRPVKIRGYVMLASFFGGTEMTKSEAEGSEKVLNVDILDTFWRMSLPVGKTMDHPFANPFGPESPSLELVKLDPILIIVAGDEIMKDRVKLYGERLKELEKTIHYVEIEGKQHGFLTTEPYSDVSDSVFDLIKDFLFKHMG